MISNQKVTQSEQMYDKSVQEKLNHDDQQEQQLQQNIQHQDIDIIESKYFFDQQFSQVLAEFLKLLLERGVEDPLKAYCEKYLQYFQDLCRLKTEYIQLFQQQTSQKQFKNLQQQYRTECKKLKLSDLQSLKTQLQVLHQNVYFVQKSMKDQSTQNLYCNIIKQSAEIQKLQRQINDVQNKDKELQNCEKGKQIKIIEMQKIVRQHANNKKQLNNVLFKLNQKLNTDEKINFQMKSQLNNFELDLGREEAKKYQDAQITLLSAKKEQGKKKKMIRYRIEDEKIECKQPVCLALWLFICLVASLMF